MKTQNRQWRLPPLSDVQKDWVIDARAIGMSFDEITEYVQEVFPAYVTDIPEDVFPGLFKYRIKQFLNSSRSSAKFLLEAKVCGKIPINIEAIPLFHTHVRLQYWQMLWDVLEMFCQRYQEQTASGEEVNDKDYKALRREMRLYLADFEKAFRGYATEKSLNIGLGKEVLVEIIEDVEGVEN